MNASTPIDPEVQAELVRLRQQVDELKQTVQTLKQANTLLDVFYSLVENAPAGIVITDLEGTITFANPAFKTLYGYGDASIGMQIPQFFPESEYPTLDVMLKQLEREGFWRGTITNQRKDGTLFPSQESALFVRDHEGNPQAMAAIINDLSEQQRAEQERLRLQEQIIEVQRATLAELSTPLIPISDTVVALPLIGSIDSRRAQQVIETLLQGVAESRAQTVILDITGVPIVDTQVANTFIMAAQAVRLLGAEVILTGIRPEVAQTLVGLGASLGDLMTLSSLQAGIAFATRREYTTSNDQRT